MKANHSTLLTALLMACAMPLAAQVPSALNFQSRISDVNGNPVGSPTPVNREVTLRVYDAASGGTLLYAEKQIATIANGDFSILLGQGDPVPGEPRPALSGIFGAPQRFLGITVDDGTGAADLEITPRQQMVSTAFAFSAQNAQTVPAANVIASLASNGLTTVGNRLGINAPATAAPAPYQDYRLTVRGDNTDPGGLANQLVVQSEGNSGFRKLFLGYHNTGNYGSIQAYDEGGAGPNTLVLNPVGGNVGIGKNAPVARLDVLTSSGAAALFNGGNVGIGTTTPSSALTVQGAGPQFSLLTTTAANRFDIATENTGGTGNGARGTLQVYNGSSTFGSLTLNPIGGNVGIGTLTPGFKLEVAGTMNVQLSPTSGVSMAPSYGLSVVGNGTKAAIFSAGNVGIGTSDPLYPLMVRGTAPQFSLESASGEQALNFAVDSTGGSGTAGVGHASIQSYNQGNYRSLTLNPLGGRVGIGTVTPQTMLEIRAPANGLEDRIIRLADNDHSHYWDMWADPAGSLIFQRNGSNYGFINSTGLFSNSDARLKEDVTEIEDALPRVMKLRSVKYRMKGDGTPGSGFIAQELQKVFPEFVESKLGYLNVNYSGLIAPTIRAVQEMKNDQDEREAENANLKKQVNSLEERLKKLEALLEKQTSAQKL